MLVVEWVGYVLTRATSIIQSSAPRGVFFNLLENILKATATNARHRHVTTAAMILPDRFSEA